MMKKIMNIVIACMFILGMLTGMTAAEDPTYEDGVLTLSMDEGDHGSQVIRISDGEIVESETPPSIILVMKLRNIDDGTGMKYIEITTNELINHDEPVIYPDVIVITLTGSADEYLIDPTTVILDLRGPQDEPSTTIPDISILDLRGPQDEPSIIVPGIIVL